LAISDQAVVLDRGSVVHHSSAQQLQAQPELIEGLLGVRR
jgi:branched-chain amino acid transport system ATP-binding protein